ncbi:MAG: hypothetical protein IJU28_00175 [Clostridia bacterium]|nr:hypothetical protein [Clostridia bacterium]
MYGRMMGGPEHLNEIMSASDNENVQMADITKHADDSKVTTLLASQFRRFYGENATPEQQHKFMHEFWNYGVYSNLGVLPSNQQRGKDVLDSLGEHMHDNEDGTDPFTSTDQSPLANTGGRGEKLDFDVASAYANHLNPELVKYRLNDQIENMGELNSVESLKHFNLESRDGVMTARYTDINGGKHWLGDSKGGGAQYGQSHLDKLNEHDRLTANRMTKNDINDIDAVKMGAAIGGIGAVSNRFQSDYKHGEELTESGKTWKNELNMNSESYNAGRLMEHLAAAANMGGDENTTFEDRRRQYVGYLDTMGSGDEAAQNELMKSLKGNYWQYLQRMKSQWGTDLENETAESLSKGNRYQEMSMSFGPESSFPLAFAAQYSSLFDPENEDDQEFLQLARYYHAAKGELDEKAQSGAGDVGSNVGASNAHEFDQRGMLADAKAKLAELEARKRGRQG